MDKFNQNSTLEAISDDELGDVAGGNNWIKDVPGTCQLKSSTTSSISTCNKFEDKWGNRRTGMCKDCKHYIVSWRQ